MSYDAGVFDPGPEGNSEPFGALLPDRVPHRCDLADAVAEPAVHGDGRSRIPVEAVLWALALMLYLALLAASPAQALALMALLVLLALALSAALPARR